MLWWFAGVSKNAAFIADAIGRMTGKADVAIADLRAGRFKPR